MGTDKRERQKANRARIEAARQVQQQKAKRQALILRTVVLVVVVVVLGVAVTWLTQRDENDTASDPASTTTTAPANPGAAAIPPAPPGETITGDTPCPPAGGAEKRVSTFEKEAPMCIDATKTYTAKVSTTKGDMTFTLDPKSAPKAVNNFVVLARYKYYDGISFHRIIPGFVIQGGDPQGTGSGGPGYEFADELPASADVYQKGTLAMANAGPNTNGSQFFIVLEPGKLQPNYSMFGKVTEGFDTTAQAIAGTGTAAGTPSAVTTINSVTIAES